MEKKKMRHTIIDKYQIMMYYYKINSKQCIITKGGLARGRIKVW
jgi:hypothetical protein